MAEQGTCFVMQPFDDGGEFDKRYDDVLAPAVADADLEPYRVDRDPGAVVPIREIEDGIKACRACLADITTGNPNVAFELGYALALDKPVVLIAKKGTKLPFDVQHRQVHAYEAHSTRDFEKLRSDVTAALRALIERTAAAVRLQQVLVPTAGLSTHEITTLVAIGSAVAGPEDSYSVYGLRHDMERLGFTPIATTIALASLERQGLVRIGSEVDEQGHQDPTCALGTDGIDWLLKNQDQVEMRTAPRRRGAKPVVDYGDIPF